MGSFGRWIVGLLRGAERKIVGEAPPELVEEWTATLLYCQRWFRGPLAGGPAKRPNPDYFGTPAARAERDDVARVIAAFTQRRPNFDNLFWALQHLGEEKAADALIRVWSLIAKARAIEEAETGTASALK